MNEQLNSLINYQSISQSINQSINQSVSQSVGQSINQSIDRSINQSIIWSINQLWISQSMKEYHFANNLSYLIYRYLTFWIKAVISLTIIVGFGIKAAAFSLAMLPYDTMPPTVDSVGHRNTITNVVCKTIVFLIAIFVIMIASK